MLWISQTLSWLGYITLGNHQWLKGLTLKYFCHGWRKNKCWLLHSDFFKVRPRGNNSTPHAPWGGDRVELTEFGLAWGISEGGAPSGPEPVGEDSPCWAHSIGGFLHSMSGTDRQSSQSNMEQLLGVWNQMQAVCWLWPALIYSQI